MMKKTSLLTGLVLLMTNFAVNAASLNTGAWRFEMRATYGTIPFVIDVKKKNNKYSGVLRNGKEKIRLKHIEVTEKGISIPLQTYEVSLELDPQKDNRLVGHLVRHNKNPIVKVPVYAVFGVSERYPEEKRKPKIDLNGRWAVTLTDEQDKKESGVIVFEQNENILHGSILTPTGDYRYMEGFVDGDSFEAASFDGVYNYTVRGKVTKGKLEAQILANYKTKIEGEKNNSAELPDAYKQTRVDALHFEFPDLYGRKVSLNDPQFRDKPVIVQIFGSWCPNCLDEMNYLIPWYRENHKRGIEVIALAFERSLSPADAKKQLIKTTRSKKIPYTLLIAGSTSEEKPAQKLPGLQNFISFPTTVFLNKKHEVVKVHAGFTGPSTGEFFTKWKKEFNETINGLLK